MVRCAVLFVFGWLMFVCKCLLCVVCCLLVCWMLLVVFKCWCGVVCCVLLKKFAACYVLCVACRVLLVMWCLVDAV